MIIVDTGPLVALFDRRDREHAEVRQRFEKLNGPLVTTLPVITETTHLLGPETSDFADFAAFIVKGGCAIHIPDEAEIDSAFALMREYADLPMDFADASLIAAAESLKAKRIFTLDVRDFSVYRVKRGRSRIALTIV